MIHVVHVCISSIIIIIYSERGERNYNITKLFGISNSVNIATYI